MNVASLELCKELYELSGWDDPDKWLHIKGNGEPMLFNPIGKHLMDCDCPAYDLGYLLRKLPTKVPGRINHWLNLHQVHPAFGSWCACYTDTNYRYLASTPEDAATKLAIELFRQGILTPAQSTKKEEEDDN